MRAWRGFEVEQREVDPLTRPPPPQEPPPRAQKLDTKPRQAEPDWSGWERWLAARLDQRLATERKLMMEAVGDWVGEHLDQMQTTLRTLREDLREAKIETARLTSELALLRETRAKERARVPDLPPLPARSVN